MIYMNGNVLINDTFIKTDVRIENGIIVEVGNLTTCSDEKTIDISNYFLIPGLIDIHTHGCVGFDFSDSSPLEIHKMLEFYAKNGVTTVAATTTTMSKTRCELAVKNISTAAKSSDKVASIAGINLEGPFLGVEKKGAHNETLLCDPDLKWFRFLQKHCDGLIKLVSVDPTRTNALEFIKEFSDTVVISLAHTNCDYETALSAFQAGATQVTHLFNAMNGLHHRSPGILGAAFESGAACELICDGIHVHPTVLKMMYALMPNQLIMISDSICATALEDGEYAFGGLKVFVKSKTAALADGTIAGSTYTLLNCLRNVVNLGVPLETAVLSATKHPAEAIDIFSTRGSIEVGKHADLLVLSDTLELLSTTVCGNIL